MPKNHLLFKLIFGAIALAAFSASTMANDLISGPSSANPGHTLGTLQRSELGSSAFSPSVAPSSATSNAIDETLRPMQAGDIVYITGGVGDEERSTLDAVKNEYNLQITSASKSGEFVGDTQIVILDHGGQSLLNVPIGPIFYAKLPSGRYTVEAASGGQMKKQVVTVGSGKASTLHLSW